MYPFGSGMPQPPNSAPYGNHNNANGMSAGVPFGAGWVPPATHSHSQPPHLQYQPLPNQHPTTHAPYPMHNTMQQTPYPSAMPHSTPYPSGGMPHNAPHSGGMAHNAQHSSGLPHNAPHTGGMPHNAPHASGMSHSAPHNAPHSSGMPHSLPYPDNSHGQHPQQAQNSSMHSPYYSHPDTHGSYAPSHGYKPVWTAGHYESPAGNMAHCFDELARRQSHTHVVPRQEGTPTVFPAQNFDPVKDAHDLRKAMKGFGTDEDALINIICKRSNEQRQEIQRQYKTNFGKDLIEDIKSETTGNFEKLLVGLLRPIVDFYCVEMNDAMGGIGTDEDVLIEILCTLSNFEIHTIKTQYLRLYGAHLESELKSETSGNFKRLLVSLCSAARDESGQIDPVAAESDARELLKAGELRVGTDESMFNTILCQRNYQQLKLIFQEYERMTGHSLEKAIKKEFSGDIMEGLVAIYKCVTNKSEYFATRLHKSMAGIGTNDKQLIRVIITRSEIDLGDIKTTFERMYGKSLKSWIKGDTSGHYKHALYSLIGEQRSS